MDMVEALVQEDRPTGITYSNSTIQRLAALRPKEPDYRIFYDNAGAGVACFAASRANIDFTKEQLLPLNIGTLNRPDGGYFITYQAPRGCARRIVSLCKEAGLILTNAGATHPYENDPDDSYIRIAPSFPAVSELETAMQLFTVCAKLTFLETLIA